MTDTEDKQSDPSDGPVHISVAMVEWMQKLLREVRERQERKEAEKCGSAT